MSPNTTSRAGSQFTQYRGQYLQKNMDAVTFNNQLIESDKLFYDDLINIKMDRSRIETSEDMRGTHTASISLDQKINRLINLGLESNIWLNMCIADFDRIHPCLGEFKQDSTDEARVVISMLASSERVDTVINAFYDLKESTTKLQGQSSEESIGDVGTAESDQLSESSDSAYESQIKEFKGSLSACLKKIQPML